jgi:integrative and conjugative element protein (TIGR02256 family)
VIEYSIAASGQTLVFSDTVIEHVLSNRQTKTGDREAGGQLFARVSRYEIYIAEATGPRTSDRRSRLSYRPDRKLEQGEIDESQRRGLVFVGDWHTHPELMPEPSTQDLVSISECFRKSSHHLNAFLLVVVGASGAPKDLHVSLHDSAGLVTNVTGIRVHR